MTHSHLKIITCAAALAAALLSGCHDDKGAGSATAPPAAGTENFSSFTNQTFKADANSQPVSLDNINLVFDVNDDPIAFTALLM